MSLMFDSLAYAKKLKAAGMPEAQAEVQAETIMDWMEDKLATKVELEVVHADLKRGIKEMDGKIESVRADLKRDIKEMDGKIESVRADLKRDIKELDAKIESVRADLKRDIKEIDVKAETRIKELDVKAETRIKELELRMVIKMGAMILGGIGLLFGLMRAWPLPVQYVPPPTVQEKPVPAPPTSAPPPVPQAR